MATSTATRSLVKQHVEDELRTLYTCPSALQEMLERCFTGHGERQLAKFSAGNVNLKSAFQHFEVGRHQLDAGLFGAGAPSVSQQRATETMLCAVLMSSARTPGFGGLLDILQRASSAPSGSEDATVPQQLDFVLVRLLRRVALWYYYRVMFDPLDQLVQLNSSYELLFQLLTPHQQLSCMADILLVLACPALAEHSGQLDTPLHTATLLSMLKMAQQMAEAEAQIEQLGQEYDQQSAREKEQFSTEQLRLESARAAEQYVRSTAVPMQLLVPPAASLFALARTLLQQMRKDPRAAVLDQIKGLRPVFSYIVPEARAQQDGKWSMMATPQAVAALSRANTCKAVGAFLEQVSQLPPKQMELWWYGQFLDPLVDKQTHCQPPSHAAATARWLQECCDALDAAQPLQLTSGQDAVLQLLQWTMQAIGAGAQQKQPRQSSHSEEQQQQQQAGRISQSEQHEDQPLQKQQQHPAEALRQVLDVVLSALLFRDSLNTYEWMVEVAARQHQQLLLAALHSHCMQLLIQARELLPAGVCRLGQGSSSSSCKGLDGCAGQVHQQPELQPKWQQQQLAWQVCCAQLQRNMLLVLHLIKGWQDWNPRHGYKGLFEEYQKRDIVGFVPPIVRPNHRSTQQEPFDDETVLRLSHISALHNLKDPTHPAAAAAVAATVADSRAAARAADELPSYSRLQKGFLNAPSRGTQQQAPLQQQPNRARSAGNVRPNSVIAQPAPTGPAAAAAAAGAAADRSRGLDAGSAGLEVRLSQLIQVVNRAQVLPSVPQDVNECHQLMRRCGLEDLASLAYLVEVLAAAHSAMRYYDVEQLLQRHKRVAPPDDLLNAVLLGLDRLLGELGAPLDLAKLYLRIAEMVLTRPAPDAPPPIHEPLPAVAAGCAAAEAEMAASLLELQQLEQSVMRLKGGQGGSSGSAASSVAGADEEEQEWQQQQQARKAPQQQQRRLGRVAVVVSDTDSEDAALQEARDVVSPGGISHDSSCNRDVVVRVSASTAAAAAAAAAVATRNLPRPARPPPPPFCTVDQQGQHASSQRAPVAGLPSARGTAVTDAAQAVGRPGGGQGLLASPRQQQQPREAEDSGSSIEEVEEGVTVMARRLPGHAAPKSAGPTAAAAAAAAAAATAAAAGTSRGLASGSSDEGSEEQAAAATAASLHSAGVRAAAPGPQAAYKPHVERHIAARQLPGAGGGSEAESSSSDSDTSTESAAFEDPMVITEADELPAEHTVDAAAQTLEDRSDWPDVTGLQQPAAAHDNTLCSGQLGAGVHLFHPPKEPLDPAAEAAVQMIVQQLRMRDERQRATAAGAASNGQEQEDMEEEGEGVLWGSAEDELQPAGSTADPLDAQGAAEQPSMQSRVGGWLARASHSLPFLGPLGGAARRLAGRPSSPGSPAAETPGGSVSGSVCGSSEADLMNEVFAADAAREDWPEPGLHAEDWPYALNETWGGEDSGSVTEGHQQSAADSEELEDDASTVSFGLKPGFDDKLGELSDLWERRLKKQHQHQQQQERLQQQQQRQGPPLAQLSFAEVEKLLPSVESSHFENHMEQLAAFAWLDLLRLVVPLDNAAQTHVSRAFDAMEQLKWDISPASESGYTVKEIQSALDDSFFLALLTAGLLYEPAMMYEDQENILLAADMLQHTRQALGAAYGKVVLQSRELSGKLVQWSGAISTGIVEAVKQAQDVIRKPSSSSKSSSFAQPPQGFGAARRAVADWVALLAANLKDLGPVPVQAFVTNKVADPLLEGGQDEAVDRVDSWIRGFECAMQWLQQLVRVEAWLAHIGRRLQASCRLLRRVQRVLLADHNDAALELLQRHVVSPLYQETSAALVEIVESHKHLRTAFNEHLARDGWGVIQRGFQMMCQLYRKRDTNDVWSSPHHELGDSLVQYVTTPAFHYLLSISPYLPQTQLSREGVKWGCSWPDVCWMQLFQMLSGFQPPIAGFWWMLPPKQLAATQMVEQRAQGSRPVYRAPEFTNSSSTAADGIAAGQAGCVSSQTQHLRLRQRKQPTQHGSLGRGPAAAAGSSSTLEAAQERQARLCSDALFQSSHEQGLMDCSYSSLDDTAATKNTDTHVQVAASELRELCGSMQELHDLQLHGFDHSSSKRVSSLHKEVDQRQERLWKVAHKCRAVLVSPPTRQWQAVSNGSLKSQPLPQDSTSDCCSDTATADSDGSDDAEQNGPAPSTARPSPAAAHFRSQQQDQERWQERQLRRLQRSAAAYSWYSHAGVPLRPWQLQRAAALTRRQVTTTRVYTLQQNAEMLLAACCEDAAATTALPATAGEPAGQLQQPQWPHPATDDLCRAAKELLSCWQASPPAEHQLSGPGLAMRVQLSFEDAVTVPQKGLVVPEVSELLDHLTCSVHSPPDPDKFRAAEQLQRCWQSLVRYRESRDQLLDEWSSDTVMLQVADEHLQVHRQADGTTRQLLWQVLQQLKAPACQWYEYGAQHYQQQQEKLGKAAAAERPTAASSSTASSSAADAKGPVVSVPESGSVELWSTLAHSIASDVLLVPPSIRDMVGNGWAAGAGRLGDMGANITSSSSSAANVAARMLVVQYARAARRKYAQSFEAPQLLSSLLTLQSLAENADLLAELRSESRDAVAAALAIHTNAAAAGMMPALILAADAMQEDMSSSSCCGAAKLGTSAVGISSSSSDRSSSAAAQAAASQEGSSQQCSCCCCSGKAACCCFKPSIFQLAAQLGCFPGMPDVTLPWLQLLTRYHAVAAGFIASGDDDPAESLSLSPQHRVTAMSFALESFGIVLPPLLEAVRRAWGVGMPNPPIFSMLPKGRASSLQSLWQRASAPATHQQPCQQTQQDGQQQVPGVSPVDDVNGVHTVAYWLHAERLVEVLPQHWQQHLADHLLSSSGSSCRGKADGAISSEQRSRLCVLADRACDHCSQPLPDQASHGSDSSSSCGSTGVFGCPVCGCAQYCSQPCADAAKKVHNANCWRLQALCADGTCWQQPSIQRCSTSTQPRSFFDLSAVQES